MNTISGHSRFLYLFVTLFFITLMGVLAQNTFAQNPTQSPPNGNTLPPINVSSSPQQKTGGLQIGSAIVDGGLKLGTLSLLGSTCVGATEGSVIYNSGAIYLCADANAITQGTSSEIWTANGSTVYYESGGVAIGTDTLSVNTVLTVDGNIGTDGICDSLGSNCIFHSDLGQSPWSKSAGNLFFQTGNVGIGTEFPSRLLTLSVDSTGDVNLIRLINENSGTNTTGIEFLNKAQRSVIASQRTAGDPGVDLVFSTANSVGSVTERLRIQESGRVGIGDDSPETLLDVEGKIGAVEYCNENGTNCLLASELGDTEWTVSGADIYRLGGDVGIGVVDPTQNLHTNLDMRTDGRSIYFGNDTQRLYADLGSSLRFVSNSGTASRIDLHNNSSDYYGSLLGTDGDIFGLVDGDNEWFLFQNKDNFAQMRINNTPVMTWNANGSIAVGTTSADTGLLIDIEGKLGAVEFCDENGLNCFDSNSVGGLWTAVGANINRLAGNVGIGDPTPSHKLDVAGNIAAQTGHLYLGATGNQDLYGDNGANFYLDSNHSTQSRLQMRDLENDNYGSLYGAQGDSIGLLDGDGHWALQHQKDTFSRWAINNVEEMRLLPAGLAIGDTALSGTLALDVTGQIGATEYCDENGANCVDIASLGSLWTISGSDVYRATGDVTIGSAVPSATLMLDVAGQIGATEFCDEGGGNCFAAVDVSGAGGGSGLIGGTGTANRLAKWTAGGNLSDGSVTDTAGLVSTTGNLAAQTGHLYLGAAGAQDLYGNGASRLYFDSNDATQSDFRFRDSDNDEYGAIYGSQGDYFGLLDGDGNWALQHQKDIKTSWRINNIEEMRLLPAGLAIGSAAVSAGLALDVTGQIGATGYCDQNGANCLTITDMGADNLGNHTASANINMAGNAITGLTLAGGGITGSDYDIAGVNTLIINDPGEGIDLFGGTTIYVIDNATDNQINVNADRVGIGDTTPSAKLDVNGAIRSAGNYTINNSSPTIFLQDTDHYSGMIHQNSNLFYVLSGSGVNATSWTQKANSRWPMYINMLTNGAVFGGNVNAISFTQASDLRLKKDISTISGLETIMQLRGVDFTWKESGKKSIGLIAQEVEKIIPEIVSETEITDPETGEVLRIEKAVEYANLVAPLIEAVKEQQNQIEKLENRINQLELQK